jgi:hypothetical protein
LNLTAGFLLGLLVVLAVGWSLRGFSARRDSSKANQEIETLQRLRAEDERRAILDRGAAEQSRKDLLDRMEALQKRVAEAEAGGRAREGELQSARGDLERLRRTAEDEARRREAAEKEADRLRTALSSARTAPLPATVDLEAPLAEKPPTETPVAGKPVADKPVADKPTAPTPGLGPTAVSDPNHVRKLTDGINALLAGVEGSERWRVASAGAVEGDRIVQVVLEARTTDGAVSKSFQAGEGRFVLQSAAGTLSIKLKEGAVTYPGNRTIPFPEGAYTVLLVVDPAPFRTSGNPLVDVR